MNYTISEKNKKKFFWTLSQLYQLERKHPKYECLKSCPIRTLTVSLTSLHQNSLLDHTWQKLLCTNS